MYRIAVSGLTYQTDRLRKSIARKAAGILQQGAHTLRTAHLVEHRTLDITGDTHQTLIGTYLDNVFVLQTDITRQTTIQNILVDINNGYQSATTEHLDVTQGTQLADTACRIQGMESCGKGRQMICSRRTDLTHDMHHDATGAAHRQTKVAALIVAAQTTADLLLC